MDYEELVTIGQKARRETEEFINHNIHDERKRWPVIYRAARNRKEMAQRQPVPTHVTTLAG